MQTIYFICYGNICRSPYAERYAAQRAPELGLDDLAFDSAGIAAANGTRTPKPGIKAAGELGVDLAGHRAKHVSEIVPRRGDLVIAMDRYVYGALAEKLGPTRADVTGPGGARLALMMDYAAGGGDDVPDPMGHGVAHYRQVYELLGEVVEVLLERLADDPSRG